MVSADNLMMMWEDTIRRRARRAAWEPSATSPYPVLNPFRRTLSIPHQLDTEWLDEPIIRSSSQESFHGPRHSNTAPPHLDRIDSSESRTSGQLALGQLSSHSRKQTLENSVGVSGELATKRRNHEFRFSLWYQVKCIFGSWINVLLLLIPAGFALNYASDQHIAIFCVNFVAIMPSTSLIALGLDEISLRVGFTLGLLLDQTFSNIAQLISSILLLSAGHIRILRISLLGAILANLLLMTGAAFTLGGLNRPHQYFNARVAQILGSFLILAVLSLLVPTTSKLLTHTNQAGVQAQSRGISVIIIISYMLWLLFQYLNRKVFQEPTPKVPKRKMGKFEKDQISRGIPAIGTSTAVAGGGTRSRSQASSAEQEPDEEEKEEEEDTPTLSLITAIAVLVIAIVLLFFNTMFATDSVQALLDQTPLTETFVGIVILPLISLSPTAIYSAIQDKMDDCLSLTIEKCIQTTLMVIPLIVFIAWGRGVDSLTLEFGGFPVATLFASVLIVTYVIQGGRSDWLVGALLIKVFVIISISAYYVP